MLSSLASQRALILLAAAAIACGAAFARPSPAPAAPAATAQDDAAGELMGELMFHADLMAALDRLCPVPAPRDWQDVLRTLPAAARAGELRELSRKLSSSAAKDMVHGSGGCFTRHYAQVYATTRNEYEALLEQWAQMSV